jgi:Fe2+ or Zn2+ uptake regulation protein
MATVNPQKSRSDASKRVAHSITESSVTESSATESSATESSATESLVRRALEEAGCRYTAQRAAVFDYLESVESHPTAEDVYQAVRCALPKISLATVYKALEALVEAHLATKLTNGDGSARYDCRSEDHYHLRDTNTGEIRDLPVEFDRQLLTKIDPQLIAKLSAEGFQVTGYRLEVLGRFSASESG